MCSYTHTHIVQYKLHHILQIISQPLLLYSIAQTLFSKCCSLLNSYIESQSQMYHILFDQMLVFFWLLQTGFSGGAGREMHICAFL